MQVYDRVLSSRSLPTLYGLTVLVLMLFVFMGGLIVCEHGLWHELVSGWI
jgi:ABC-type protease/lipase transport system fused ATPase/permease subunit